MAETTAIGWTDHTFNPWWGCVKISPACDACYAERDAHRYGFADGGGNGPELWGPGSERRHLSDKTWNGPRKWDREAAAAGRKALVFCASMADVFEARDDLDADRARLWELIEETPNLIWLLLTKRPEQILRRVPPRWLGIERPEAVQLAPAGPVLPWSYATADERARVAARPAAWRAWPSNAWVGTTVEDQQRADLRIPRLLTVPAPVRFLSMEPLLGPVDLGYVAGLGDALDPSDQGYESGGPAGWISGPTIDWIIVGGESGPSFRPMDLGHARSIAEHARRFGVPVYFKQVSGARSGARGPDDLEALKAWPDEAGDRGAPVEIR